MLKIGIAHVSKHTMYESLHILETVIDPTHLEWRDIWDKIGQLVDTQLGTTSRETIYQDLSRFDQFIEGEFVNVTGVDYDSMATLIANMKDVAIAVHAQIPNAVVGIKFIHETDTHILFEVRSE